MYIVAVEDKPPMDCDKQKIKMDNFEGTRILGHKEFDFLVILDWTQIL